MFKAGRSATAGPLRVAYRALPAEPGQPFLQAGFSVSKRYFKRAVDRNRIKRLLRETYRMQKTPLYEGLQQRSATALHLFFIYTGRELPTFAVLELQMQVLLTQLTKRFS